MYMSEDQSIYSILLEQDEREAVGEPPSGKHGHYKGLESVSVVLSLLVKLWFQLESCLMSLSCLLAPAKDMRWHKS